MRGSPPCCGSSPARSTPARARSRSADASPRCSSWERAVESVELLDAGGRALQAVVCGDPIEIRVRVRFHAPISRPTVGVLLRDRFGNDVFGTNTFGTNTFLQEIDTGDYEPGQRAVFSFRMEADLGPSDYGVAVSVHSRASHVHDCYDWIDRCLVLRVLSPTVQRSVGTARLRSKITVERAIRDRR